LIELPEDRTTLNDLLDLTGQSRDLAGAMLVLPVRVYPREAPTGLEPGTLNPYAVAALREEGIDISGKETVSAFELLKQGRYYTYVITVCDETSAETCPIFPGCRERFHWSFPDPSKFTGTDEEIMTRVREVRDQIRDKITEWVTAVKKENKRDKLKAV
jgi:arsenate reductase